MGRIALVYWKHLRVPFQLMLAPLFLFGWYLADGQLSMDFAMAFISLHVFLYPGVTAFNSAYDRDTGPVTGMLQPPEVPPGLRNFSLVVQLCGALLAALVGPAFLAIYGSIALLAFAYSHPSTRWKASPWGSTLVVGLGQGALGFLAGWCAAAGDLHQATSATVMAGSLAATLTTAGLYPSTQVFQIDEDEKRGDRTLAVALGAAPALRLGTLCLAGAAIIGAWLVSHRSGHFDAALIFAVYTAVIVQNEVMLSRLSRSLSVAQTYGLAQRTGIIATAGFLLFAVYQVARP